MPPLIASPGASGGPSIWNPHPEVLLLVAVLLGGYVWAAVRAWGPEHTTPGEPAVTLAQRWYFVSGVFVIWLGASSPIHELSENYLFSVHMVQHLLFSLVAPPLLLMGTPGWMVRHLLRPKPVMKVFGWLCRPLPALVAFNGYLLFSHWPEFVNATVRSEILHFGAHAVLFGVSLLMWWPVLSPLPELPRIGDFAQFLYMIAQTFAPTVPFAFLVFADDPLYSSYAEAPRIASWLDPMTDQRTSGLIMKLIGSAFLWAIAAVLFFRWYSNEEKGIPAAADWQSLEREVNKV
jgi:putative membrane protein